jgi:hypothetical protein
MESDEYVPMNETGRRLLAQIKAMTLASEAGLVEDQKLLQKIIQRTSNNRPTPTVQSAPSDS